MSIVIEGECRTGRGNNVVDNVGASFPLRKLLFRSSPKKVSQTEPELGIKNVES